MTETRLRALCSGRVLIALCGAPASGKTTLADQCADLATIVSVDRIRSAGRGGGLDPYGPKATRRAFNAAYAVVDDALRRDEPAILDSTASSKQARASILRLAAKHDAACHLVVLDEPLETLLGRNAGRDDGCPDEVLRKLHTTLTAGLKGIGAEGFESVHICSADQTAHLLHGGSAGRFFRPAALSDPAPRQISLPDRKSGQRRCAKCGDEKPTAAFYRDKTKGSGYRSICKSCDRAKSLRYYHANSDKVIARVQKRNPKGPRLCCRCGEPATSSRHQYCDGCRAETGRSRERRDGLARKGGPAVRPKTSERGYGTHHQALRKQVAPLVAGGGVACARCGGVINPDEPWDLGHDDHDRSKYTGPEHRRCNRATAGRNGLGKQSRRW